MSEKSWQPDSGHRRDNQMTANERVICILQKNKSVEQRVVVKDHETRKNRQRQSFIDIREYWYKDGHLEEPIPTKKGTMVHRKHLPKIILALLGSLDAGEIDEDTVRNMRNHLSRIEGKI